MYQDEMGQAAEIRELKRRIRVLETQAPVGFTAVSRGALRILSPEGLIVEGSASVTGTLTGSGTFDWTGPMNLKGAQTITGPTTFTGMMTVNGSWKFAGNGQITGNVSLTGDLTAGNVKISPSTAGGQIGFGSSRRIDAGSGYLGIYDGSRFIVFNSGGVAINGGGGPTLTVGPGGIQGAPTITMASAPPGSFIGAAVFDGSGALRRVVA